MAAGTSTVDSDLDVAVYFHAADGHLDLEELKRYPREKAVEMEIERLVGRDVEMAVLNRAPAVLGAAVFYDGTPIHIRDDALRLRFYLAVTDLAEEYRGFARDCAGIKARSLSLSEVDRDKLVRTLDFLESELADAQSFAALTRKAYTSEAALRRNVERWIENIVNASIDIAKTLVSSRRQHIPQTYRETLQRLETVPGFSAPLAEELAANSSLRNILAHEYLDVRYPRIREFVSTAEEIYGKLIQGTRTTMEQDGSSETEGT